VSERKRSVQVPSIAHLRPVYTEIHEQEPEFIWTKTEAAVGDWTKYITADRAVCQVLLGWVPHWENVRQTENVKEWHASGDRCVDMTIILKWK